MSVRNLDRVFKPQSVALIGATSDPQSLGGVIAANLVSSGFKGPVLPVTAKEPAVNGVLSYPDIAALPLAPDLAVILAVPAEIPAIVGELGELGTRGAIVIPAGFADHGEAGLALQQQMLEVAKPYLLRLIGPNCMGVAVPGHGLNASFVETRPLAGDLAFLSQSGAVMSTVVDWATSRSIGFSHLVSVGDMADVDFGDLLDYLLADPKTRAILLHMEAVTNARKFLSAARAAARTKPVVVLKAGRTETGALAVLSHTGAIAGEEEVYRSVFRRAGMLQDKTHNEIYAAIESFGMGLRVHGDRLAILSNAGGLGVLSTDELASRDLRLAHLGENTRARLGVEIEGLGNYRNPIDLGADAGSQDYGRALAALLDDRELDAILAIHGPTAIDNNVASAPARRLRCADCSPKQNCQSTIPQPMRLRASHIWWRTTAIRWSSWRCRRPSTSKAGSIGSGRASFALRRSMTAGLG